MDQGNREEERWDPGIAVAVPTHLLEHQHQHYDNHNASLYPPSSHHEPYPHDNDDDDNDDIDDDDCFVPSTSAASSAHAADSNVLAVAFNNNHASPVNPDNFYRGFRDVDSNVATPNLLPSFAYDPMAPVSNSRQTPPSRSTSNGTPTTTAPSTGPRTATRPMYRSASNPVDDRVANGEAHARLRSVTGSAAAPSIARASVKDMKKRFEQNGAPSPPDARRVVPRTIAKDGPARTLNGRSATVIGNSQSYSALRSNGTPPSRSNTTQRSKFVPEDHISTNSQSFASRINRPKANAATNAQQPSRSMSTLNKQSSFPPPASSSSGGPLLFGEIRQEDLNLEAPGYGIDDDDRLGRTESTGHGPMSQRLRSQSDALTEPSSPTDWYRGASSPQKNGSRANTSPSHAHNRSQSDLALSKLPPINTNAQVRRRVEQSPSPHTTSSRLPVFNRKLGTPSTPASPASTRSNSPAGTRRLPPSGRTSRQQNPSAVRAKTPVSRSKTPTSSSASRRTPVQNSNGSRLATVISPPPRLSPPLRSSRPRQPVSEATTASSRLKAIDRSKSPQKSSARPSARPESRQDTPSSRRRKLSVGGPVDFAQRRETIKLKYSKSIRETEARQAREVAAEKRKKELQAAAKAKARAQARAEAQVAAAQASAEARHRERDREAAKTADQPKDAERQKEDVNEVDADKATPVDEEAASSAVRARPPPLALDSPTLGLPGTFPSSESPTLDRNEASPSALSETSAVTEFDNEAQTEAPVPESSAPSLAPEQPSQQHHDLQDSSQLTPSYERATYRDPFEDIGDAEDTIPIQIALDESSAGPSTHDRSLHIAAHGEEPYIPGAFMDEHETTAPTQFESNYYPREDVEEKDESETLVEQPLELGEEPQPVARDEYEPPPFIAQPYHTTTVTIISRDTGFGGPIHGEPESVDTVRPPNEPQMNSLEDFYTGPRLKDNMATLRDSTFMASEADVSDGPSGSGDAQRTPDTSNSLNIPSMTTPANRSSQHSLWTDLSYSSRDSRRLDFLDAMQVERSRPQSLKDDDDSYRRRYLDGAGHLDDDEVHLDHERGRVLDTRGTFFTSYAPGSDRAPDVPKLPHHVPPLAPDDNSRPTSGYDDEARPSTSATRDEPGIISFPVSRRESEDYHDSASPRSLDSAMPAQTPLEDELKEGDGEAGPTKKEKSRLRQRQLCIKEIVDTEAVFVRDMSVIEEIYKGTAEACPKLDDKTIKLIFRNTHEIIAFHTTFLSELKEGVTSVYVPRGHRTPIRKEETTMSDATTIHSVTSTVASTVPSTAASSTTAVSLSGTASTAADTDETKDRQTVIAPAFIKNIEQMRIAHEGFLRTSDVANKRLIEIQQDPTVQVWLNECNEVARDLTAAWNLDSLLIKPMQRITKYPNLISQLLQYTPVDHPDREGLMAARVSVENAILEINKTKKNFELVGQIVGRKRKESDVKAGFARAFGKRVDKLQASSNRPPEDPEYLKFNEKFSDDYLRLQVVLRDVEFYTRQVSAYVQTFLDYLSAMELVMRLQPGPYPELESKWVQFNVAMRDIKTVALDQHLLAIRKNVIEPFELVIRSYQNPLLAMKKRNKRRLDYERSVQLKKSGKKIDKQLAELVEHYEALNDTLKKELPKLSALTEKVGNICLGNMINIQASWWCIWQKKINKIAGDTEVRDISDIVTTFQRDFREMEEQVMSLGILNHVLKPRSSVSTMDDSTMSRIKSRPSDLGSSRSRGMSVTSDQTPVLPTPDFARSPNPSQFPTSPPPPPISGGGLVNASASSGYFRDYYSGLGSRGPASPASSDFSGAPRSIPPMTTRPGTGRSFDSTGGMALPMARPSTDSLTTSHHLRRESNAASSPALSGGGGEGRRSSGLFQSALPLTETADDSQRGMSSRGSSRERHITKGYNVLWLAASLFEFNIETTKHEAGYPYLIYTAGEIFDVIAEKGELWLAKNQDDPHDLVGWIWSKHFAKLADS